MYIISKNHNFPEKFKVIYQIIQNEILNNLLEESKFYILLTAFYFIEMTHISEFLLSNKTVILKNIREILQKSYIFVSFQNYNSSLEILLFRNDKLYFFLS